MARPATCEVDTAIGISLAQEMAKRQDLVCDSEEQREREAARNSISRARQAHKKVFETAFSLDPAARVKNSLNPNITFWARFHGFDSHGTFNENLKLDPDNAGANIGIIGATIAIKRNPTLHLGVDIQKEDLEHRLIVGAAIKGLKSPAMDIEDENWHLLNGIYVPKEHDKTIEEFKTDFYETMEHNAGLVVAANPITVGAADNPFSHAGNINEAIAVVNALSAASDELRAEQQAAQSA